jgi:hypothetical protein
MGLDREKDPRWGDLWLGNGRVMLDPQPRRSQTLPFAVAFLGHCPGMVRPERLRRAARQRLAAMGFGRLWETGWQPTSDLDRARQRLQHVPLPIASVAELYDLFPEAATAATSYASELAGGTAWLPRAVEDFFTAGGREAVVIVLPEEDAQDAFRPVDGSDLTALGWELVGLGLLRILPDVALLAMPDLERLQIPADLADPSRKQLPNPVARFVPCGSDLDDDHRERRNPSEMASPAKPRATDEILRPVLRFLASERPDVQCLFTLPVASRYREIPSEGQSLGGQSSPAPLRLDEKAVSFISGVLPEAERQRLQAFYPYLRGPRFTLGSPTGLMAGTIARSAQQEGPWVSVAGRALSTDAIPLPALSALQATDLRNRLGVGVLVRLAGTVELDDERSSSEDFACSAEVIRFWGYLRRELERLGQQLVFRVDPRDSVPRIALEGFFSALYQRRALRGSRPADAFRIWTSEPAEGAVAYEIELCPAFPVDRIRLAFVNSDGQWSVVPRAEVPGA